MNITLHNLDLFIKRMEDMDYKQLSDRFLVKEIEDSDDICQVNITIDSDTIIALTGYTDEDEVTGIPKEIVDSIKEDIDKANE